MILNEHDWCSRYAVSNQHCIRCMYVCVWYCAEGIRVGATDKGMFVMFVFHSPPCMLCQSQSAQNSESVGSTALRSLRSKGPAGLRYVQERRIRCMYNQGIAHPSIDMQWFRFVHIMKTDVAALDAPACLALMTWSAADWDECTTQKCPCRNLMSESECYESMSITTDTSYRYQHSPDRWHIPVSRGLSFVAVNIIARLFYSGFQ
jgi:hypothetical protein